MVISGSALPRMKMFQTEVVETIKIHILSSIFSFEYRAVYEIRRKNIVEPGRTQMTKQYMHIACLTTKATNTHSDHAIFIAFPLEKYLHERASVLRYIDIVCLMFFEPCIILIVE